MKASLSLNRDKYFALYWCFCVVFLCLSFILLLIKWSEMDPNVKPHTLVETFDQANSNSIPEYVTVLITLLAQPAQLSVASAVWRDCKLLYKGPWQMRDWALSLSLSEYEHKDVTDIDGIITEFACLKGTQYSRPLRVTSLMESLFYPFLP